MIKYNQNNGIALIQVLLITAILSVLALYLTGTAKEQVKIAQWASDKSDALVSIHSAESKLYFYLLTTEIKPFKNENTNNHEVVDGLGVDINNTWNFFSESFNLGDVVVQIQDQAGLLNTHFPDVTRLKQLFIANGYSKNKTNNIVDSLRDWQDIDSDIRVNGYEGNNSVNEQNIRNGAVSDISDFLFNPNISEQIINILKDNTTIYKQGHFNPVNAPLELLSALTDKQIAEQVIQLREQKGLTKTIFSQLTGLVENDDTFFFPSNYLQVYLMRVKGDSKASKNVIIHIEPYASHNNQPINILANIAK